MEVAPRMTAGAQALTPFLAALAADHPDHVLRVRAPVDPANFDVTALLVNLERAGRFPVAYFEQPLNLLGEPSRFPLVTNLYADRVRCARALGLPPAEANLPLSLEYARRESRRLAPVVVAAGSAPVKEVVQRGADVDLRQFPIVRHHTMDGGPYIDMGVAMKDRETGAYNTAFLRTQYKGPRKLGLHMSPRHNWQIVRKYEQRGEPCPVALVVSHHPAFYLGVLNVCPFGTDDYSVIGAIMDVPLRLAPSETWGADFLVPADADIVIEGQVLPGVREVEGPFGEFTGTYGPQRVRWVIEVTAVTHRHDAVFQNVFTGHRDVHILGGIPKEGALYNRIKGVVPTVKAVHLPVSGCCRFHCYIAIDKKVDGESKQAALIAMGECDFVKNVIVVDGDIDPFNEEEVLWAFATRVQADQDLDVLKNVKGNTLDPSLTDDILTAKTIIDATRPLNRPFASRLTVPDAALQRMSLDRWVR